MRNNYYFIIISVFLLLFSIYLYSEIDKIGSNFRSLTNLTMEIDTSGNNAIAKINNQAEKVKEEINNYLENELNTYCNNIIDKKLILFESKLSNIQQNIQKEMTELEKIKSNKLRELDDLPEYVDLDNLYQHYKDSTSVSFDTEKGQINFSSYNIKIVMIPSIQKIAWIRIGKEQSSENTALIKAWLIESTNQKIKQNYKLISNKTNPSDYGEYTEKLYTKGDMYFKTYYQYIRYQGTYDSKYYRYTYYVEVGSTKRRNLYIREQYNSKLGS